MTLHCEHWGENRVGGCFLRGLLAQGCFTGGPRRISISLDEWGKIWLMKFNKGKCKVLHFRNDNYRSPNRLDKMASGNEVGK